MSKKKVVLLLGGFVGCSLIGAYFAIPSIVESLIEQKLTEEETNSVQSVHVSWAGPQTMYGVHIESAQGFADVDITIPTSLFGLLTGDQYTFLVHGDALFNTEVTDETSTHAEGATTATEGNDTHETNLFTLPALSANIQLDTFTLQGDESLVYSDVQASAIIKPGSVFSFQVQASTDTGGAIICSGDAPDVLTEHGEINWDASASIGVAIKNAAIPTINGQGGWSIIDLAGEISSSNLRESIVVSMVGRFAQYDVPKGYATIKTQLQLAQDSSGVFSLSENQIVGTIDVQDIPTSILAPLVTKHGIDTARDIGETMEFHLSRATEETVLQVSFRSEHVQADGTVHSGKGTIENVTITAHVNDALVQRISNNELQGEADVNAFLTRLVPIGQSEQGKIECEGSIVLKGELLHVPTQTKVSHFQTEFTADVQNRRVAATGSAVLNDSNVTFVTSAISANKNKLNGVEDLITTVTSQLPRGNGMFAIVHVPVSILHHYLPEEHKKFTGILGSDFSVNTTLAQNTIRLELTSETTQFYSTLLLEGKTFTGMKDSMLHSVLSPSIASELSGITITSESVLHSTTPSLSWDGTSEFTATYDIGKKSTFVNGTTTRVLKGERAGQLDAHLAITGIDMQLVDAVLQYDNVLADSLGSPLAVEISATDITNSLIMRAGGTSPKAAFETTLGFFDGKVLTIPETTTKGDLQLSPELTQHLLKDLGPVLSDIRSVTRPIEVEISNASTNLQGDVSSLNADIRINIGEVELDSGAATLKLLPMFNTQHVEIISAFFDPIYIEIRNGIARYKKFNLTLVDKFSIPYSGSVNLVERTLDLKTAIPLTGLGYSIKELRGLTNDIDVPILITGSIDNPNTRVDPAFDLGKLLQNAAISALGDAIGGALQGDDEDREAPNPLDLLEELLGGH